MGEDDDYYNIAADDYIVNDQDNESDDANSQKIDDYYASVVDDDGLNQKDSYYRNKNNTVNKNMCYAYYSMCNNYADTCLTSYYDDGGNNNLAANKYLSYSNYMGCKK